jgi:uncharacterized repeat protein (TIGR04138 family)
MMMEFYKKLKKIIKNDPRYKADAYEFVMQALWFTQKKLEKKDHVTGKELLEGIREFGLEQFGPMTKAVFQHWGIRTTADFGEIVFNMVDDGIMRKTTQDSRDDFKNVYEFDKAFDIFNRKNYHLDLSQDKKDEDKDLLSPH